MAQKKIARPHLVTDAEGEKWLEYEGHTTNEIAFSPNGQWVCGVFRLQERVLFILANFGKVELKFLIQVPLTFNVSDKGVAATVEYTEGGRRLSFFFPDGAVPPSLSTVLLSLPRWSNVLVNVVTELPDPPEPPDVCETTPSAFTAPVRRSLMYWTTCPRALVTLKRSPIAQFVLLFVLYSYFTSLPSA